MGADGFVFLHSFDNETKQPLEMIVGSVVNIVLIKRCSCQMTKREIADLAYVLP